MGGEPNFQTRDVTGCRETSEVSKTDVVLTGMIQSCNHLGSVTFTTSEMGTDRRGGSQSIIRGK